MGGLTILKTILHIIQIGHSVVSRYERARYRTRMDAIRTDPGAEWARRFGTQWVRESDSSDTDIEARLGTASDPAERHRTPGPEGPGDATAVHRGCREVLRVTPVVPEHADEYTNLIIANPPERATAGAGGYDLYANETVTLPPGEQRLVKTGWAVRIPSGWVGLIQPRSGLAVRKELDRRAGVIDDDYRGELCVLLRNEGSEPMTLGFNDRIAQMTVVPCLQARVEIVTSLDGTPRGGAGFGSTGGVSY